MSNVITPDSPMSNDQLVDKIMESFKREVKKVNCLPVMIIYSDGKIMAETHTPNHSEADIGLYLVGLIQAKLLRDKQAESKIQQIPKTVILPS